MVTEIEEVVGEALAHARNERRLKATATIHRTSEPEKVSTQALYLDPKNWTRTRGIALMHAETQTLLGNFSEYIHMIIIPITT